MSGAQVDTEYGKISLIKVTYPQISGPLHSESKKVANKRDSPIALSPDKRFCSFHFADHILPQVINDLKDLFDPHLEEKYLLFSNLGIANASPLQPAYSHIFLPRQRKNTTKKAAHQMSCFSLYCLATSYSHRGRS
ncbi:hypothetical protein, partial [Rossellomorea marisflavi]|uniref:hypothetical protein n=1 Tax=Rossellomorea marisflavi TaxID=189381 RepID=UPI001F1A9D13